MRRLISIGFVFVNFFGFSQKPILTVSKNPVLVGEPFSISVLVESKDKVTLSKKWDTLPFRMKNEVGIYEMAKDKFEIISFEEDIQNNQKWSGTLKAIIWDSGTFVFPALSFNTESNTLISDSLLIESQLEKKKEGIDLYEIRESFIDVKDAEKKSK
jgi:hypothetical protein